jgi:hypothetical protein
VLSETSRVGSNPRSRMFQAVARAGKPERGALRAKSHKSGRTAVAEAPALFVAPLRGQPNAEAVRVLREAYALLRKHGWFPHYLPESERFAAIRRGDKRARGWTLVEAIQTAGQGSNPAHWARQVVQRIVGPIPQWEQHPLRVWREVELLIFRAIEVAGGSPPKKGNWTVSSGPWKSKGGAR